MAGLAIVIAFMTFSPARSDEPAPASKPAVSDTDAKFVADTLASIDANAPDTIAKAQNSLEAKGKSIVPALKQALDTASPQASGVLDSALVALDWGIDAPKVINDWVRTKNEQFKTDLTPVIISAKELSREFPEAKFYFVGFRQYPVAMEPPAPLSSRNIFMLSKDAKVKLATNSDDLKAIFKDKLPAVKEDRDAKDAVIAWLEVSKEVSSDGWMKFTIPHDQVKVAKTDKGSESTGVAVVGGGGQNPKMGDRGQIDAKLTFDGKGKLTDISEEVKIQPGIRPMCQATKLLDPDPLVRKICEQDLLIMGSAAREYIMEQRAKATPQLQKEIDRVWQLILDREKQWREWTK